MKTNKTRSICVYICTIYTYMHHQILPKYDIPSWPSLCTLWKTRSKWDLCWIRCFCCFQVLFSPFLEKHHFSYKKCHISWKHTKPCQYVCIHVPFTHTFTIYTTKYHQNIRYIWLAFPLYSMKHQVKMRDLWFESAVLLLFMCFSEKVLVFMQKVPHFMKTNKTR